MVYNVSHMGATLKSAGGLYHKVICHVVSKIKLFIERAGEKLVPLESRTAQLIQFPQLVSTSLFSTQTLHTMKMT